jgi:putative phosphoribosyl transferase
MIFRDREHAGQKLAEKLTEYADRGDVLVLALPRGGVPVAYEVAKALIAPLDVFLVRKLGVPGHEELAMGAIASGGTRVLNETVVGPLHIPAEVIDAVAEKEERELLRRESEYRNSLPPLQISGHTVILIDDGLATGATMRAAAQAIKKLEPRRLVIAVPVSAAETCDELEAEADAIICATMPQPFYGVGMWYRDFSQTSDQEVKELLESNRNRMARRATGRGG